MVYPVGVKTKSMVPDVSWKVVNKGRRTRKPNARSPNSDVKLVNKSPKRVGDFSCCDSYKFSEAVNRHHVSNNVEHVPIKKRRHLRQPSSPSQLPSHCGDSSGIATLAAAAYIGCIEDTSSEKLELNNLDSAGGEMLPDTKVVECAASHKKSPIVLEDLNECIEDGEFVRSISPKIDRLYWDLNTSMDSWEQPNNDGVRRNVSNNVIGNEKQTEAVKTNITKDHLSSDTFPDNNTVENVEKCIPLLSDTEENKSAIVFSLNATCAEEISSSNMGHLNAIVSEIPYSDESVSKVCALSVTGQLNGKKDIVSAPITITTESGMQFEHKEPIPNCAANSCTSSDEDQSSLQDLKKHGLPEPPRSDGTASPSMKFRMSSSLEEDAHNNLDVLRGDLVKHNEDVPGFQGGKDDSLFEDGELPGPVLFPWEENDGDYEMECVDYGSDGDDLLHSLGDHKDIEIVEAGSQGIETINSSANICQEADFGETSPLKTCSKQSLRGDSHLIDVGRQNGSGAADHAGMSMEGSIGPRDGQCTDNMDSLGFTQAFNEETCSSTCKGRLRSHIEVPLHLDATESKDETLLLQKCRNTHVAGGSYPRLKRDFSPEERHFSSHYPRRKNVLKGNWGSRSNQYLSRYSDYEDYGFTWRRHFATSVNDFETDIHHYHPHSLRGYSSKRSIFGRRASVDRDDDCLYVPRRLARGGIDREERGGFRRSYNDQQISGVFTEKGHISLPRRSHLRSRSPGSQREGTLRRTRPSMSPDSSRTRVAFQKPHAAKCSREGFVSSSARDHNPRWADDRSFAGNHSRQERVHVGDIGWLRFGNAGSRPGKPDDHCWRRFEPDRYNHPRQRHDETMQQRGRCDFGDRRSALKRYREDFSSY